MRNRAATNKLAEQEHRDAMRMLDPDPAALDGPAPVTFSSFLGLREVRSVDDLRENLLRVLSVAGWFARFVAVLAILLWLIVGAVRLAAGL